MKRLLLSILLILVFSTGAFAVPLTGSLDIAGLFQTDTLNSDGSNDLGNATQIIFGDSFVFEGTGSYSSLPSYENSGFGASLVSFLPLTFAPELIVGNPNFDLPFWEIFDENTGDLFGFNLETIKILEQSSSSLVLYGTGTLTAIDFDTFLPIYDDTPGYWTFAADQGITFTSYAAAPVPEPGTLLLLGSGLIGLAYLKRRKS